MKDEFMGKYMPPFYFANLLHQWRRITQGNNSAKKYVAEFNEFLIRHNIRDMQSDIQIFFQFRNGLKEKLDTWALES